MNPRPTSRVELFPISPLGDWRWQLEGASVTWRSLEDAAGAATFLREQVSLPADATVVLTDVDTWSDANASVEFLHRLADAVRDSPGPRVVVTLTWRLFDDAVVPRLGMERFETIAPARRPFDESWVSLVRAPESDPGVLETLHAETGGNLDLAKDVLAKLHERLSFGNLAPALDALHATGGPLELLSQKLIAVPMLTLAINRFIEDPESARDARQRFEIFATGFARAHDDTLAFSGSAIERFARLAFGAEHLAVVYERLKQPEVERTLLERVTANTEAFAVRPAFERARIHRRLAQLNAAPTEAEDPEPAYFEHAAAYLPLAGQAERLRFLSEDFIPVAAAFIKKPGYTGYRAVLERFVNALAILTGRAHVRLYGIDPDPLAKEIVCLLWRHGPPVGQAHTFPVDGDTHVSRVARERRDFESSDVSSEPGVDLDFVRRHAIRSLVLWPLVSDNGKCFGVVAVDNPYEGVSALPQSAKPLAKRFIEAVAGAVQRAVLVDFDVRANARLKVLVDVLKAEKPRDLLDLALRFVHDSYPMIEFAAVRLYEGERRRRRRLMATYPSNDPALADLSDLVVVINDSPDPPRPPSGGSGRYKGFYEPDLDALPDTSPLKRLMKAKGLRWTMVVPLELGAGAEGDATPALDHPLGQMTFYGSHLPSESEQEREHLERLFAAAARQVQLALENILRDEAATRRAALLAAIGESFTSLARDRIDMSNLREHFLRRVLSECCWQFDADIVHCLHYTPLRTAQRDRGDAPEAKDQGELRILRSEGPLQGAIERPREAIAVGQGVTGMVVKAALDGTGGDSVLFPDVHDPQLQGVYIDYARGVQSSMVVVLRDFRGGVLGALTLDSKHPDHFDSRALALAREVAESIAHAIEFVELIEERDLSAYLAEMGKVATDMSHWLGNVVPLIRNRVERAREAYQQPRGGDRALIEGQLAGALDVLQLLDGMREDLRPVHLAMDRRERVDLAAITRQAAGELPEREGVPRPTLDIEDRVELSGIPRRLHRMVHSLLRNAQDAVEGLERPATIRVLLATFSTRESRYAHLVVRDNGPGLPPEKARELGRPFNSTKPPTRGTGLGLYSVRNVVQAHNGKLEFVTAPGEGMAVHVTLPLSEPQEKAP